MKQGWKTKDIFFIVLVFLILLIIPACTAANRAEEVRKHWNDTVAIENKAEAQFGNIVQSTNEGYQQIATEYPLIQECFDTQAQAIQDAVSGRYDESVEDGSAPTGQVDAGLLINALSITEDHPDFEECGETVLKVADDITVWRQRRLNLFTGLWDTKVTLDTQYQGDLYRSLAVDLLQFAEEEALKLGLPVPDYVYPTFHLEVVSRDREICDYYDAKWNPALGQCTLSGKGAYEYIFRPFVSAEVQESFDSGIDDLNPLED